MRDSYKDWPVDAKIMSGLYTGLTWNSQTSTFGVFWKIIVYEKDPKTISELK